MMNPKLTAVLLSAIFSGTVLADDMGSTTGTSSDGRSATGMSGSTSFDNLDQDTEGYLSKDEVTSKPTLKDDWANADADGDGKLDRSEFSQFETMHNSPGSSGSDTMHSPGGGAETTTPTPDYVDPHAPASGAIR